MKEYTRLELEALRRVYVAGIWQFGHWKDGTVFVGTTGATFREVKERVMQGDHDELIKVRYEDA